MKSSFVIALASATIISTSASAGNLISPIQEDEIVMLPDNDKNVGALRGSAGGGNALLIGGLLLLVGIAAGSGT